MSSVNITEMEGIMRMGVNQETQLNSLLTYYRNKVEDCNRERQQWIAKYDQCKFDADLKHKLQWENRHLKDRIQELERALSHHKTALYDERQNYLRLIRQNTDLKKKQGEDTRKIQQLLNVCEPLEGGMVMCKDVRSELTNNFIVNDLNIHKNNGSFSGNGSSLAEKVKSANSTTAMNATRQKKSSLQKTNISSTSPKFIAQPQTHEIQIMNLKKIYQMQVRNLEEQNSVLKQELQKLRENKNDKFDNEVENYKTLLQKYTDLDKKHNGLAQEYFAIRMKLTENQQRVQQSNQLLRVKNIFLAEKMKQQEKKYDRESKAIEELVTKRNNDFKTKYKQQMKKKEEHLSILKQQYQKIQQIYLNKIKTLEDHLSKLNDKYNQLTKKSKREITYLNAQLKVMEKRVEAEQVQKMRLQIQQLQQQQKRKQEEQQRQEIRLKKQTQDKKKKKIQDIEKAYRDPQKTVSGRFKKNNMRQVQESQEQDESSVAEVDSEDIDNIQRHIQDLEHKLGLNH